MGTDPGSSVKISISLPPDVLEAADRERRSTGESRSAFIRRAVGKLILGEREREVVERYVQAYSEDPEADELRGIERLASDAWADLPWEEEG
jgi:metal-responsive CopG/Arc/MetJ family transcriptional regulator